MKTLIAFLILCGTAFSDPWLVCDPYDTPISGFKYSLDGGEWVQVSYEERIYNDEKAAVVCDLAGIADGSHNIKVKAFTVWGESKESFLDFEKSIPGQPLNIRFRTP